MADPTQPYDELAPYYDQIFEDWEARITRQATVIAGILDHECGDRRPIRVRIAPAASELSRWGSR